MHHPAYVIYTSGSTGVPKGVTVTHAGLGGLVEAATDMYHLTDEGRFLHVCSPSFDPSVLEWTAAFWAGATLVIVPPTIIGGPELAELLRSERVTHAIITPAVLSTVDPAGITDLKVLSVGGDVTTPELLARWEPGRKYFNGYGPTETTIISSYARLQAGRRVTIGTPVHGMSALVLDARLHPVPPGVAGELYLSGGALARGYHDRTGQTAARFVPNPWGAPGARMYRTGDIVRWFAVDGVPTLHEPGRATLELDYVGRSDFQVKVRGYRIELGEIDATIAANPDVDFVTTQAHKAASGATMLVAYVTAKPGRTIDTSYLIHFVARRLPNHMVPASVVVIDEVPLTPVGKLDRKALPVPVFETREFRAPSTPIEQIVADVFSDVLGVARVGVEDDFFDLGGNSLSATQVTSRIGAALDVAVPVRTIFEASTVAALAARVETDAGRGGRQPLVAGQRPERVPLSLAQQRMWFLNQFDPSSAVNNIPVAIRLRGDLDVAAMQVAIIDVLERHESLRTVFPSVADGAVQTVIDAAQAVPDLTPVLTSPQELPARIRELASMGFDVTDEVPLHAGLFELGESDHVLAMVVHHISADGWSMGPLARDVMIAYSARVGWQAPAWSPLPVQYADFALWQREVLGSEDDPSSLISRQLAFWSTELTDLPEQLDLPRDRPRPAVSTFRGGEVHFPIDAELHRGIEELARRHNATRFMVVHAALSVLLSRLSGTDDIVIGTPVAGRGESTLDDLIGMFVNTLVLRTRVNGHESFASLLGRVCDADLAAFGHSDVPFERLVEVLNPPRSEARHPLFQVMLSFQNLGEISFELPELSISGVDIATNQSKFDLSLTISERLGSDGRLAGMEAGLTFARDLFDADTVEDMSVRFVRILRAAVADDAVPVGDIELLSPEERMRVLREWNATSVPTGGGLLLDGFEQQVAQTPHATAVVFEGESLTYGEFAARVNILARKLIAIGVGPESRVGLAMRRGVEMLVSAYAVVTAGGAYLPVDPDLPRERTDYILESSDPVVVLTTTDTGFTAAHPTVFAVDTLDPSAFSATRLTDADRAAPLRESNTAYVIYTSGSTGRPKGVAVSHAAIVNRLAWMQGEYWLDDTDVVLWKTPATFDVSVWELFWSSSVGGRLVIAAAEGHRDPAYLSSVIDAESVTTVHFVPSMLALFLAEVSAGRCTSLRRVFASGEALGSDVAQQVRELVPGVGVHNLYGPTEAAVDVTHHSVTDADISGVPIGRPVWNTKVFVLDARLRPVPVRVPGELYLAGVQVARGYVGRPDLTADRFVADPFGSGAGERLYRTGDLVRWNNDGELEYLGRTDFQVKLRGQRIELGEIEAALLSEESVAQAVVMVRTDELGDRLVGYVVPSTGLDVDAEALRTAVGSRLPSYMVPDRIIVLGEFPLTTSGKLDRKALPLPIFEAATFRAPVTPVEQVVAAVFADVLGVERVGLDDDFFASGGNSLVAMQVVSRVGAVFDKDVPVRAIFDASTVERFAARVASHTGERRIPLAARTRPARIPLSYAQQRYWFLNQFDTSSAVDHIPAALRLSGVLDIGALQAAVADLVERHESLRTRYPADRDGAYQVVVPADTVVPDLGPDVVSESGVSAAVLDLVLRGFDVTAEVPLRARLLRIAESEHEYVLVFVVHHVSGDGFSMAPLTRDLMVAYEARRRGERPEWAPLPVQYADYGMWQRGVLGAEDDPTSLITRQIRYWTGALAGLPDQLELPTDRPRPPVQSFRGAVVRFSIDADLHQRLATVARRHDATLFMVAHAALAVLLSRLSGTEDIAVGTPIAGRGERELDDLIGMFVNTLLLRTEIDAGETFSALLTRVRETDLGAFGHADVPFERLVEVLNPVRSTARNPLFQIGFLFQNFMQTELELPGLAVTSLDRQAPLAKTDLQVTMVDRRAPDGSFGPIDVDLSYATDLFDESTVRVFGQRLARMLAAVAVDPDAVVGDVELLDAVERARVVEAWNDTAALPAGGLLLDRFQRHAALAPDAVAVVYEGDSLTYGEFAARVNRLARYLVTLEVGPEVRVGLGMRRGIDLMVGMYAAVTAGAAYVPLDPDHPVERTRFVLDSAAPAVVLTTTATEFDAGERRTVLLDTVDVSPFSPEPLSDADRIAPLRPENTAYVIYTSGSTGRPKGVAVPHSAIVNQVAWLLAEYRVDAADVYLQKTAATFDLSVWGFFVPLAAGARLVLATPDGHRDPVYLSGLVAENHVTITDFVPSMLSAFAASADAAALACLRDVLVIGEALPPETVRAFTAVSPARVHNLYGPTEAAVSITAGSVDPEFLGTSVSIGVPEAGSRVYVLDGRLRPVPVGVAGELYLAGVQLARGYVGRADLTAERFVADPFDVGGGRLYRTGDVVRWNGSGELEYVGRSDFQVKVRGFRIELGEIEAALAAQPGVAESVVVVHADAHAGQRLVGYVTAAGGAAVDGEVLRARLVERVPSYMVPERVVVLAAFPLNASGKLDRRALPVPVFEAAVFRAPVTPVEQAVAEVFGEVLGVARVGLDDDFFALGGNSLVATQVVARLGQRLDATLGVRLVFEAPTVERLAVRVESQVGAGRVALVARERPGRVPLSLAQQRMWFLNRLDPGSAAYNIPVAIRLTGRLDVVALRAAVADVVARHEVLRTVYPEIDGHGPAQVVLPPHRAGVQLDVEAISSTDVANRVAELAASEMDVTARVPLVVRLLELTDATDEFVLVLVVHHVAADGSSLGPLTRDVMVAYDSRTRDEEPAWFPLPLQYADYALWQREVLGDEDDPESLISQQIGYWTRALAGIPDQLELPTDRPRPAVQSFRGGLVRFPIDADLHRELVEVARAHDATLFMVVHAALAVLLARLSGTDDIAVGTPIAGRGEPELDDLIGMFVNTLVLRTEVDGDDSFTELLARVRDADLGAFGHADVPFERLVEVLNPARSQARHPLFQVGLSFQNLARTTFELPGLTVSSLDADRGISQFDLHLILTDSYDDRNDPTGLDAGLTYAADLFDESTARTIGQRLVRVLTAVAADPTARVGDVDLLDADERSRVLEVWSAGQGGIDAGAKTLGGLFADRAELSPDAVAVVYEGDTLTYGEFAARVNRLARYLVSAGVRPETRVALGMRRGVDLVVAMFAVATAGGAYVPVDPDHPAERARYVVDSADPLVVLTTAADGPAVPDHQVIGVDSLDLSPFSPEPLSDADRIAPLRPENTAYVIYTSGSTGRPKGVAVSHAAVVNQLLWKQRYFGLGADDAALLKTTAAFDLSVWEFWSALASGGRLVIAAPDGHRDAGYLNDLLTRESVTTLHTVPSMLQGLLVASDGALAPSLRRVLAIGEALPVGLARRLATANPDVHLFNLYGPTEAAVSVTVHPVGEGDLEDDAASVSIGVPEAGSRVYVLDGRLRPVPVGVAGELYLAGVQLARGYVGRADLTAE
ncbi:MAG: amino acid adenylation domain-containing protein, partial [Aldersonia sp.]|nr:amino acid adenylation domain-containing protein [Aldersonia sp.]